MVFREVLQCRTKALLKVVKLDDCLICKLRIKTLSRIGLDGFNGEMLQIMNNIMPLYKLEFSVVTSTVDTAADV